MNTTVMRALCALTVLLITPSVATAASTCSNVPSVAEIKTERDTDASGSLASKVFNMDNIYIRTTVEGGRLGDEQVIALGLNTGLDIKRKYTRWGAQLNLNLHSYAQATHTSHAYIMASLNLGLIGGGVGMVATPRGPKGELGWLWIGFRQLSFELFTNVPWIFSPHGHVGGGLVGEVFDTIHYRAETFLSGGFFDDDPNVYVNAAYRIDDRLAVTAKMQWGDESLSTLGVELRR